MLVATLLSCSQTAVLGLVVLARAAKQRPYVTTTEQVWALHDAVPEHMRVAILRGAFVGLRTAEAVALRVEDADFMRGIVRPTVQ